MLSLFFFSSQHEQERKQILPENMFEVKSPLSLIAAFSDIEMRNFPNINGSFQADLLSFLFSSVSIVEYE